jgi:hypothetical protein
MRQRVIFHGDYGLWAEEISFSAFFPNRKRTEGNSRSKTRQGLQLRSSLKQLYFVHIQGAEENLPQTYN